MSKPQMREGFMAILSGEFKIGKDTFSIFNKQPIMFWKYLFVEGRVCGWTEDAIIIQLSRTQPYFKKDQVMEELHQRRYLRTSPLKTLTYNEYFIDYKIKPKKAKKAVKIQWHLLLDVWWQNTYNFTYRYVPEMKKWYHYQGGIFEAALDETIQSILKLWLETNLVYDLIKMKHALQSIKLMNGITTPLQDFDAKNDHILNIKDGLLYLDKTGKNPPELKDHTPSYPCLLQMNVNYRGSEYIPLPCWEKISKDYPQQIRIISWFLRTVIYNQMENEKALYVVGKTRSGKGTVMNLIESMFHKKQISSQGVPELGGKNSLGQLVGCLVAMDKETTIQRIIPKAVKRFKAITGRDGKQVIDIKNKGLFEYDFDSTFFINAGNYCYQYPTTDVNAFLSRWIIVEYNTQTYNLIPQFKEDLIKEKDGIFYQWVNQGYETYATFYETEYKKIYNLQEDIKNIKDLWHKWSDPVTMVCDDLFEFVNSEAIMTQEFVIEEVKMAMEESNFFFGSERTLIPKVKIALKKLKIHHHHSNALKYFRCIRFKDSDRQSLHEDDFPVPERTSIKKMNDKDLEFEINRHLDEPL